MALGCTVRSGSACKVACHVATLCLLSLLVTAHAQPDTQVTYDGTSYIFTPAELTWAEAEEACVERGGHLSTFRTNVQVSSTIWSDPVTAVSTGSALYWIGLQISWPAGSGRKLLRGFLDADASRPAAYTATTHDDADAQDAVGTAGPMQQTVSGVSSTAHLTQRRLQQADGDDSSALLGAQLSWSSRSADLNLILSNAANLAFLHCNRQRNKRCCGAVFDIGPEAYPGSPFFYPCTSIKASYMCEAPVSLGPPLASPPEHHTAPPEPLQPAPGQTPVAELPRLQPPSPRRQGPSITTPINTTPNDSSPPSHNGNSAPRPPTPEGLTRPCPPGQALTVSRTFNGSSGPHGLSGVTSTTSTCQPCDPGHYSAHGRACLACQPGYHASRNGSTACKRCNAGTEAAGQGTGQCGACKPGFYASKLGSRHCKPCPAGHYAPLKGATRCRPCLEGMCAAAASSHCMPCGSLR